MDLLGLRTCLFEPYKDLPYLAWGLQCHVRSKKCQNGRGRSLATTTRKSPIGGGTQTLVMLIRTRFQPLSEGNLYEQLFGD